MATTALMTDVTWSSSSVLGVAAATGSILLLAAAISSELAQLGKARKLPPGDLGLPFVGNVFEVQYMAFCFPPPIASGGG